MKFGEKIVKLRKMKGLTQDEFASAVGVSRQAVYKWESGQSYPEVSKLVEMKVLFNISIDDLLDENYEIIVPEKNKRKRTGRTDKEKNEKTAVCAKSPDREMNPANEEAPEAVAKAEEEPVLEKVPAVDEAPSDNAADQAPAREIPRRGFFSRFFGRK